MSKFNLNCHIKKIRQYCSDIYRGLSVLFITCTCKKVQISETVDNKKSGVNDMLTITTTELDNNNSLEESHHSNLTCLKIEEELGKTKV